MQKNYNNNNKNQQRKKKKYVDIDSEYTYISSMTQSKSDKRYAIHQEKKNRE